MCCQRLVSCRYPRFFQVHRRKMSWGSSSSSSGWGKSGWSSQDSSGPTDPYGQHNGSCIAEYEGFGKRGRMSSYYDPKCTGCERDRSSQSWGSANSSKGNKIIKGLCLIGGANILRKGIWDWDPTICQCLPLKDLRWYELRDRLSTYGSFRLWFSVSQLLCRMRSKLNLWLCNTHLIRICLNTTTSKRSWRTKHSANDIGAIYIFVFKTTIFANALFS